MIQSFRCFFSLSAPTTQDQTPSSAVSVATPSVSVSTSAPSATPVQTVPQTLPPAVPHAVPQPTAAIPAFPPVMVPPFRVPLPGMPIPLPGKLGIYNCLISHMSMLSICLHSCVHCVWNLPESSSFKIYSFLFLKKCCFSSSVSKRKFPSFIFIEAKTQWAKSCCLP